MVSLAGLFRPASAAQVVGAIMVFRNPPGLTEDQLVEVLDLMDGQGWPSSRVAERYGVSRNAIIGARSRVLTDLAKSEGVPGPQAQKPENRDGGMPHGWWRKRAKAVA